MQWNDLSKDEQHAIRQMAHGPYLTLTTHMADRLKEMGLAEDKLGGTGLSQKGKDVFATVVAQARR